MNVVLVALWASVLTAFCDQPDHPGHHVARVVSRSGVGLDHSHEPLLFDVGDQVVGDVEPNLMFPVDAVHAGMLASRVEKMSTDRVQGGSSWARSGELTTGGSQRVTLQAQFPKSDVYTVQFEIGSPGGTMVRAEAEVTWSVAGNRVVRRYSPQASVALSGVAEAVQVSVRDVTPGFAPNSTYPVSIMVSSGSRAASVSPPTLYEPFGAFSLGPGGSTFIAVPQLVGVCSMLVTARSIGAPPTPYGDLVVEVSDGVTALLAYDPREITGWMPVQAGAITVLVSNGSATNSAIGSLVWGVDG